MEDIIRGSESYENVSSELERHVVNHSSRHTVFAIFAAIREDKSKPHKMLIEESCTRMEWNQLSEEQKEKAYKSYNSLSENQNVACETDIFTLIEDRETTAISTVQSVDVNDRARLLHLFCDVNWTMKWTEAYQELPRTALDDKERLDPFDILADAFNDYTQNVYLNPTVKYTTSSGGIIEPLNQAEFGMANAFSLCKDIDPTGSSLSDRTGVWIKDSIREFKALWAPAYEKYKRSGQQDGENIYEEWQGYIRGQALLMYAFVLFKGENIENFNSRFRKVLIDEAGTATSVLKASGGRQTPHSGKATRRLSASKSSSAEHQVKKVCVSFDDGKSKDTGSRAWDENDRELFSISKDVISLPEIENSIVKTLKDEALQNIQDLMRKACSKVTFNRMEFE